MHSIRILSPDPHQRICELGQSSVAENHSYILLCVTNKDYVKNQQNTRKFG